MSPTRAPPGDAVARCRDAIEAIISAPGHKYNCEKNELLQLLSQSHVQVSARALRIFSTFFYVLVAVIVIALLFFFFRSRGDTDKYLVSGKYCFCSGFFPLVRSAPYVDENSILTLTFCYKID